MIVIVEATSNKKKQEHWKLLTEKLSNCETLLGSKKWDYYDWIKQLQSYDVSKNNLIILDSWLTFRAENRLDDKEPLITDAESMLLNRYVDFVGGHIDFLSTSTEDSSIEDIMSERGCLKDFGKKVLNEITYEIMQAKIFMLCNPIKK